ncbi:MAG: hypothetical protein PHS55_03195 [Firmicutes bacterium]|jgi:hypothetical protein|nr:hypothetical protein [Bacillota bacterium]
MFGIVLFYLARKLVVCEPRFLETLAQLIEDEHSTVHRTIASCSIVADAAIFRAGFRNRIWFDARHAHYVFPLKPAAVANLDTAQFPFAQPSPYGGGRYSEILGDFVHGHKAIVVGAVMHFSSPHEMLSFGIMSVNMYGT